MLVRLWRLVPIDHGRRAATGGSTPTRCAVLQVTALACLVWSVLIETPAEPAIRPAARG